MLNPKDPFIFPQSSVLEVRHLQTRYSYSVFCLPEIPNSTKKTHMHKQHEAKTRSTAYKPIGMTTFVSFIRVGCTASHFADGAGSKRLMGRFSGREAIALSAVSTLLFWYGLRSPSATTPSTNNIPTSSTRVLDIHHQNIQHRTWTLDCVICSLLIDKGNSEDLTITACLLSSSASTIGELALRIYRRLY